MIKLEEKEQETQVIPHLIPQVIPLSLDIQQLLHHHWEFLFYRKTLVLIIQTHNFPKGTISLLPQKTFMVSWIPTAPTSWHTQGLHVYERLGFCI